MAFNSIAPLTGADMMKNWPHLVGEIQGPTDHSVQSLASALEAGPSDICFAHQEPLLKSLAGTELGILVAPLKLRALAEKTGALVTVYSPAPEALMVEVLKKYFQTTPDLRGFTQGVHPTAVVAPSATVHPEASVGPFVVVGENVKIGAGSFVGAHTVLGPGTTLGRNVTIHPSVVLGPGTEVGDRSEVHSHSVLGKEGFGYAAHQGEQLKIPHLGRVVLNEDVHIGAGCTLDRGTLGDTVIGRGTKIDNQCHIAHNCRIGAGCVITAHFVMAGSSTIGDYFVCGGKTVVSGHLSITDHVHVAALSAISKSITQPGAYGGYPLQPLKEFLKTKALSGRLMEFKRDLAEIKKKLQM